MFVKTLIASLCVIGVALAEQTPVFLWGANSVAQPALHTVSQSEFADSLSELLADHMVVAFQENGLTGKDFLCSNDKTSQSCYAHLQGVSPKTYYTGVENPAEALRSVAAEREHNSIDKHGKLSNEVVCNAGKVIFVTFDDATQAREATLAAHDAAIAAVTKQLDCKVAYLYMAAPSTAAATQRRTRRAAGVPIADTAAPKGGFVFRQGNQFLMFFQSVQHSAGKTTTDIQVNGMTVSNSTTTPTSSFSVSLATATEPITFTITSSSDGYYTMSNVQYNGIKYRSQNINSLKTFSYFCGQLTLAAVSTPTEPNDNRLIWNSIQFQAPFSDKTTDKFVFGDAWHCVGFFTPGILGGLFVVILMLIILFIGVCWMMDMKTMDRFDDPKGKTITISANE